MFQTTNQIFSLHTPFIIESTWLVMDCQNLPKLSLEHALIHVREYPWPSKCISREISIRFQIYHEFSFNPHKQAVIIISSILPIIFINYIMRKSSEIYHLHSKIIQNHPIFTCFSLNMEPTGLQPRRTTLRAWLYVPAASPPRAWLWARPFRFHQRLVSPRELVVYLQQLWLIYG